MALIRRLKAVWRTLFRARALDSDLDRELAAYVEMLADEKTAGGTEPAAARRQARIEIGGVQQVKEAVRLARRGAWLESWWQDVRYGARMIRRAPGASAAAVLTLAIGIGATTAIFTVINAVVLRPLPYRDSARLFVLSAVVGRGLRLAGIGMVAGIAAALGLTRFLSTLLFGVTASDPTTFGVVTLLLGAIAAAACYLPARRASRVDPVVALRCE
jgi:hypothetical protein